MSRRYCVVCEDNRTFKLNRIIGHSECKICGSRFASKAKKPQNIKRSVFEIIDMRIKELQSHKQQKEMKIEPLEFRLDELKKLKKKLTKYGKKYKR